MEGTLRNAPVEIDEQTHQSMTGRGDPEQKFRIYRLCVCFECLGVGRHTHVSAQTGKTTINRCQECRGEGKVLDLMATCANPQAVGVTIIQLAGEGEFEDCPIGILEDGGSWLVKPWLPSPRNVTDAARLLASARKGGQ